MNTYTVPERNTDRHKVTPKLREKEPMLSQLTAGYLESNIKNGHGAGTDTQPVSRTHKTIFQVQASQKERETSYSMFTLLILSYKLTFYNIKFTWLQC